MLNVDKYRDEIDRIIENGGVPRHMISRMCLKKTNLESVDAATTLDWLFSEYEPPLLENGDGLKPGDWIMVKDSGDTHWRKRQFLCVYDDLFVAAEPGANLPYGGHAGWEMARLPEGGE